jgi:hypothetical protein
MKKSAAEIRSELSGFTGTEKYYSHPLGILLTDGAKAMAEICAAFWLLDICASYKFYPKIRAEEFVVFKLRVNLSTREAVFTAENGNDKILKKQIIPMTDFPLDSISLYYCNNVLHLPSEY